MTSIASPVAWLTSSSGIAAVERAVATLNATAQRDDSAQLLALTDDLRSSGLPVAQVRVVSEAARTRRRARRRWRRADEMIMTRDALEQASDPGVAAWRAQRVAGTDVLDVCAGAGADAVAFAATGGRVAAFDRNGERLELLAHLARLHRVDVGRAIADAEQLPAVVRPTMHVHADPGRRDEQGRRLRRLDELIPPVDALRVIARPASSASITLPPAVDLADPALAGGEVEFVQVGRSLVEAVLWLGAARHAGVLATATVLDDDPAGLDDALPARATMSRASAVDAVAAGPVGAFIVDVAPAAIRARLHDAVARQIAAHRVTESRAVLTTDVLPPSSPWYAVREVEQVLPARPKRVRAWLRTVDELPVEVVLHGVDADPEAWWRGLGQPPRGPNGRRIEILRTTTGAIVIATRAPRAH
ncbi:MAG: hypothetical protein WD011_05940 [Nitriliruptoraceae bacterium]